MSRTYLAVIKITNKLLPLLGINTGSTGKPWKDFAISSLIKITNLIKRNDKQPTSRKGAKKPKHQKKPKITQTFDTAKEKRKGKILSAAVTLWPKLLLFFMYSTQYTATLYLLTAGMYNFAS